MNLKNSDFYPFFDPYRDGNTLGYTSKLGIALGFGAFYMLLQYYALPDKTVFFKQYCWILGIIISTALMALYIATDLFRRSVAIMNELEGDKLVSSLIIKDWMNDKRYLMAGFGFATLTIGVSHLFGVPADLHATSFSLAMIYVGFFLSGFTCGLGLQGIVSIIVMYLKFAPNLQHSLDPNDPDGNGGIKKLGDALWFFGMLIGAVGILISIYMFGVQWANVYKDYVRIIFLMWLSLPYIIAISVVLIPGLAVRRQVDYYKSYATNQLKQEKARLYTSFKQFDQQEDDAIITQKKELNEKLIRIQKKMENLRKMRKSHIDANE
ncbi:MAG: hypothetical protein IIC60_05685 [Proteobacteria bacterium]|nr:hypothetical protein [Pseudomonadota bacterium]